MHPFSEISFLLNIYTPQFSPFVQLGIIATLKKRKGRVTHAHENAGECKTRYTFAEPPVPNV